MLGHDAVTVHDLGEQGGSDERVLAVATSTGRAVLTHNRRHFRCLHRLDSAHAGIFVCTEDHDADALAGRIHDAAVAAGQLSRQIFSITRPQTTP